MPFIRSEYKFIVFDYQIYLPVASVFYDWVPVVMFKKYIKQI